MRSDHHHPGPWVPFDLEAIAAALKSWPKPADRGALFYGFHCGASGAICDPRATTPERRGHDLGSLAKADAAAKKRATSEANRARAVKRWSNRIDPGTSVD